MVCFSFSMYMLCRGYTRMYKPVGHTRGGFSCISVFVHVEPGGWCHESSSVDPHTHTLFLEAGSLNGAENSAVWLVSLTSLPWGCFVSPPAQATFQGWNYRCMSSHLTFRGVWGSEQCSSSLCSKYFSHWAISTAPLRDFWKHKLSRRWRLSFLRESLVHIKIGNVHFSFKVIFVVSIPYLGSGLFWSPDFKLPFLLSHNKQFKTTQPSHALGCDSGLQLPLDLACHSRTKADESISTLCPSFVLPDMVVWMRTPSLQALIFEYLVAS